MKHRIVIVTLLVLLLAASGAAIWWFLYGEDRLRARPEAPTPRVEVPTELPEAQGPEIEATVGPNAGLPPAAAGSRGCAGLDAILANELSTTPAGQAFEKARQDGTFRYSEEADPAAYTQAMRDTWLTVVDQLVAHKADLEKTAGDDADAKRAVELIVFTAEGNRDLHERGDSVVETNRQGEPHFGDDGQPVLDQETLKLQDDLARANEYLSWCMPTWPVVF